MDHDTIFLLVIVIETSIITGVATRWAARRFWSMSKPTAIALGLGSFWGMIGFLAGVLL
ncbi:hypothetical protein [Actinomadura luteofluorescens]|uniref:hypothetical protein n=1 Tax=Actinomadura luteofluorescens TaxID=46163 RepID=UPI003D8D9ED7